MPNYIKLENIHRIIGGNAYSTKGYGRNDYLLTKPWYELDKKYQDIKVSNINSDDKAHNVYYHSEVRDTNCSSKLGKLVKVIKPYINSDDKAHNVCYHSKVRDKNCSSKLGKLGKVIKPYINLRLFTDSIVFLLLMLTILFLASFALPEISLIWEEYK